MKRKISVVLDDIAAESLENAMLVNNCGISDAINAAIIAFAHDKQPVIMLDEKPENEILSRIINSYWCSVDKWCKHRSIIKSRLLYLIRRTSKGHNVCGFGNTKNKWRDKQDGRLFKTHTAWIAHCLKEDFGIEL